MEGHWQESSTRDGYERNINHQRGSLGLFIERSTSAPPTAMMEPSSFLRNDLLDAVTEGYADLSLNKQPSSLQRADEVNNYDRASSSFLLQNNYEQFMRHSTGTDHMAKGPAISRPLSASGTTITSSDDANDRLYLGEFSKSHLVQERSQSAAPSFLSPPPGLGLRNRSDTDLLFGSPASAPGGGAVRPAAKTLMDLIQEDIPSDNLSSDPNNITSNPYDMGMELRGSEVAIPSSLQQQVNYGPRSTSPSIASHSIGQTSSFQRQLQESTYVEQASPMLSLSMQHRLQREQQQPHLYQQDMNCFSLYLPNQPSPPLMEQQQQINLIQQQQYGGINFSRESPEIQQGGVFVQHPGQPQHPLNVHQQLQTQQQPQQRQIFYGGQQQGLQNLQQPQPNVQGLQAHVLSNGQTVYISTGPSPAPQQQQSFGRYTPTQYQAPQQTFQIAPHQQINNVEQTAQFLSVVPMQGGQQVTYWQPNCLSQQQSLLSGLINCSEGLNGGLNDQRVGRTSLDSQFVERQDKGSGRNGRRGNVTRGRISDLKSTPTASPLLEEFRLTKTRDWTMQRIEGHVVEFCQDQNGSRFIQQRFEMGNVVEQQIVIQEVLPAIRRLRNDVFGNYVVQKILDFGIPQMKADIRATLEGEMLQLSLQMYGCRVVQKALETLDEDDLPRLLREFHHNVLSCIHDQNGNHVIQKCVEVLNNRANKAAASGDTHRARCLVEQIDFIIVDVLHNTSALSCHPYGCRVLQRILEHCSADRKTEILDEIRKSHRRLLDDQYGNYVIQHVLQFGRETDRDSILGIVVEGGLLGMSRQKFASNVVEKLLKYGNGDQRRAVVREMLKPADDPSFPTDPADGQASVVLLMVRDAYANYVVQTTLDVIPESDEKQKLLEELNSHTEELRNFTFAKHIVAKMITLNGEH